MSKAQDWANLIEYYLDSVASEAHTIEAILGHQSKKARKALYVAILSSESFGKDVHRLIFTFQNPNDLALSFSSVNLIPHPVICSFFMPMSNPAENYKQILEDLGQFKVGNAHFYNVPLKRFISYLRKIETSVS